MANRILKDSIWDSPTLAALPDFIQDQFPRWLLLADDWGCFCAEIDTIKGKVYPKRPQVTPATVEGLRLALYNAGLLFCWMEGDRTWGFWTTWGEHNYITSLDESGARLKMRRRTPEPPAELLRLYLERFSSAKTQRAAPWDIPGQDAATRNIVEQRGTSWNNAEQGDATVPHGAAARNKKPNPDPDPDLDSDLDPDSDSDLSPPAEKRGGPGRDLASDHFAEKCLALTGVPYVPETPDFVMLAKLRKAYHIDARGQPPFWPEAVENFFASALSQYSLADLANPKRYAVFKNSPVDGYGKPVNHQNRHGKGKESYEERVSRINRETAAAFDRGLPDPIGDGPREAGAKRPDRALLPGP